MGPAVKDNSIHAAIYLINNHTEYLKCQTNLNDVACDVPKITTTEQGISAVSCVVVAAPILIWIKFVIHNADLKASRVLSECGIKNSCLERRQQIDEQHYPVSPEITNYQYKLVINIHKSIKIKI
jgi:hypothetical protein